MNVIEETGTVIRVEGRRALVQIRAEADARCAGCTACRSMGELGLVLWVEAEGLSVGDRVTVEVPIPNAWHSILLVFALPLAALLTGLFVGSAWGGLQELIRLGPEATGMLLGLACAAAVFLAAILYERRFNRLHRPRVLEVQQPSA